MQQKNANPPTSSRPPGFALVVTLVLMVLLSILALGLLSLSSVALRTAGADSAMTEARQNARLSVIMAVGRLQSLAGQDARITAGSGVLSESNVNLTGVWRSWEGSDREASGKPFAPDYGSKMRPGVAESPPDTPGEGRFLGWLASSTTTATPDVAAFPGIAKTKGPGSVPMISTGSVSKPDGEVHIQPTLLNNSKGAFAWWVSGENSKAMINTDHAAEPVSIPEWHSRLVSNGRADAESFGLGELDDGSVTKTVPSRSGLKLVDSTAEIQRFHDLTSYSRGLLTNSATGGWRKDLSLLTENFAGHPDTDLPFFTVKPGTVIGYSKAQPSSHAPKALLYPWAQYRADPSRPAWAQVPPICSWSALANYATQTKNLSTSGTSRTAMPAYISNYGSSGDRMGWQERARRSPVLARVHWIYSLASTVSSKSNDPSSPDKWGKSRPALMITPVVTLWNPYNVELGIGSFQLKFQETAPLRFTFKVGDKVLRAATLSEITSAGGGYFRFDLKINQAITLAPGASRVFGLNNNIPQDNSKANNVVLSPGYKPNGGFLFYGLDKGQKVYAEGSDEFAIDRITYDATTREGGQEGFGIIFDILVNGGSKAAHRMAYEETEMGGPSVMAALYPPITAELSTTVSQVEGIRNRPFASALFSYRMASPPSDDPRHKHLFSKGMLQANPLCHYTEIGFGDSATAITSMAGTGVYHPINAPYDFAFQSVNGWNDTQAIPQFEAGSNSGYIVSGLSAGNGLTRCVMAEIPTRALQSLGELQHFDARNNNPIPPFHFNLIGNGSANPIFAPDQLYVSTEKDNGMCNDDTYLLNHMFFDDWFFSSIAPEYNELSSSIKRPAKQVLEDHLNGTVPLPNRLYRRAGSSSMTNVKDQVEAAFSTSKDSKSGMFPYETIASGLEVEGMFNINSVSVDAWAAILRQNRDAEVPYLSPGGSTSLASASSFPYPRTSVSGDKGTDSGSGDSNPLFPGAAEFAGHRILTDGQIEALAAEIVSEIRKRGPFLSLSEFVNRRISTDKDLAIAGTVQKALDNLAARGNSPKNPFAKLQSLSVEITSQPPGNTDYKFPEAALGSSAFGVPGWIRQADILTPLAPVISARDDTFTIRGYGDSRDKTDPTKILARAWCEVTVQRTARYVDPSDAAETTPHSAAMTSDANKRYGRRFEIVSFKWLNPEEI